MLIRNREATGVEPKPRHLLPNLQASCTPWLNSNSTHTMNLESPPIKKGLLSLSQFYIKVLRIRMMSMKIKIDENEMLN